MKNLFLILIFFTGCNSSVQAQSSSGVVIFTRATNGGDRIYNKIIGTSNEELLKMENELHLEYPFTMKYAVSKELFQKITKYVSNNCNTVDRITRTSDDYFIIKLITNGNSKICYLENKEVSRPYLQKLLKQIQNSRSNDRKKLTADLEATIRSLK